MAKAATAGGEIDSWCTKCKLVLNHRIIAMVSTRPVRVECSTCGSHHNYRPRAPGEKAPATGTTRAPRATTSRGASVTRAQQAALDREREWEKAVSGKTVAEFRPYRVSETFAEGDLIRHTRFGDGVVVRVIDTRKVEILFKDEPRTLAQGLVD